MILALNGFCYNWIDSFPIVTRQFNKLAILIVNENVEDVACSDQNKYKSIVCVNANRHTHTNSKIEKNENPLNVTFVGSPPQIRRFNITSSASLKFTCLLTETVASILHVKSEVIKISDEQILRGVCVIIKGYCPMNHYTFRNDHVWSDCENLMHNSSRFHNITLAFPIFGFAKFVSVSSTRLSFPSIQWTANDSFVKQIICTISKEHWKLFHCHRQSSGMISKCNLNYQQKCRENRYSNWFVAIHDVCVNSLSLDYCDKTEWFGVIVVRLLYQNFHVEKRNLRRNVFNIHV